ncbi:MAG: bifunctional metallophosphatase/5'-nucleotidase [Calditrichaeota bacterium]|nr:bifunctional metallophosphatase/5'-nucleotidase [Calditrichota bacterium]
MRTCKWLIFALFVLALASAAAQVPPAELVILHTNDMHAQFQPSSPEQGRTKVGGMVALEYFVQKARSEGKPTLLLDAGDYMTGTPLASMEAHGARGGGFVEMMNIVGYNAAALGNHEFDNGQDNLKKLIALADFDVLCANLWRGDSLFAPLPYKVYQVGPLRVGVIGLILEKLFDEVARRQVEGLRVEPVVQAAQRAIDELDPITDLIILLTHQGDYEDRALASAIRGADVIIGGHSHTRIPNPQKVNGVIVAQTGSNLQSLGRLDLQVAADSVVSFRGTLIPLLVDSVHTPNPRMVELVDGYQKRIEEDYGQVIGRLLTDWRGSRYGESNVGNFVADVMRKTVDADFATINSGGIRKNIKAGPLRKLDIVELLPFANTLVTFECTGKELLTFLEFNARNVALQRGGLMQVSGLTCTYQVVDSLVRVVNASVRGKPINPRATYRGVTVDFVIYGQAERYMGFEPKNPQNTGLMLSEVVIDYIKKHPRVSSKVEGRFKRAR